MYPILSFVSSPSRFDRWPHDAPHWSAPARLALALAIVLSLAAAMDILAEGRSADGTVASCLVNEEGPVC
ncbi:MAG: hypothetical protein JNL61_06030 [Rhizobiaceae bacterium]|nr:hypothetical protein [Rhizobiaceae bacterium]